MDPKTIRELVIDLASFKREVDPQFRFLKQLFLAIGSILVAIVGGAIFIWVQIGDLKATASGTAHDVAALKEEVGRLETAQNQIAQSQRDIAQSQHDAAVILSRLDARLGPSPIPSPPPAFSLDPEEQALVRSFLGLKGPVRKPPEHKVGDIVPTASLKLFPEDLQAKVQKLNNKLFAYDNQSAIIAERISGTDNAIVVAIVNPI